VAGAESSKPRDAVSGASRKPPPRPPDSARRLIATKCSGDPHIKFPTAMFEDLDLMSPAWRSHVLAAAAYSFWGSDRPDLPVIEKIREAIKRL
jgi:hypothetical protein